MYFILINSLLLRTGSFSGHGRVNKTFLFTCLTDHPMHYDNFFIVQNSGIKFGTLCEYTKSKFICPAYQIEVGFPNAVSGCAFT